MHQILIVDTETTGLDADYDELIEVGAILFDLNHRDIVGQVSFVLPCHKNPAEHINGINHLLTVMSSKEIRETSVELFLLMAKKADLIVAHNASFDEKWFRDVNYGLGLDSAKWVCSMSEIKWPKYKGRGNPSVANLALAYGVPVWSAHRALTDCIYLAEVMRREPKLCDLLQSALEPRSTYISLLSYDNRHLCKEHGFVWDRIVPRKWARKMTLTEAMALPFEVQVVK